MPEVQWYYARKDEQFGPVSAGELKQLADAGRLSPDDLLWREGMDAWTTAINLRGLFTPESTPSLEKDGALVGMGQSRIPTSTTRPAAGPDQTSTTDSLRFVLRSTQIFLWGICVLVVLAGLVLFTRAFLVASRPAEQAAVGALFSTYFVAAYVLARAGEKLSRLLLAHSRRRKP